MLYLACPDTDNILILSLRMTANEFRLFFLRKTEQSLSVSSSMFCSCSYTPGIRAPMHGINFGQVPPQRSPGAHLDSSHWVDVVCDLKNKSYYKLKVCHGMTSPEASSPTLLAAPPSCSGVLLTRGAVLTRFLPVTQAALHCGFSC